MAREIQKHEPVIDRMTGRDISRFGTRDPHAFTPVGPKVRDVKVWYDEKGKLHLEVKELQPPPK